MKLIGILGGTFDPIHFGHLRMAQELTNALGLNEVRFVPSANPPHRDAPTASAVHRAAMARLAIENNAAFVLDECELERFILSGSPSYTIDTLHMLRTQLEADTTLCLLMGSDAFMGLASWRRWEELLGLCHIVVAHRPSAEPQPDSMPAALQACWKKSFTADIDNLRSKSAGHILLQHITPLDISASAIRLGLGRNDSPRYLMPDEVISYIEAYQLYR
jgi:nicotinate-nucleotide adenylyltransferase